jgi:hypothetical protein
MRKRMSGHRIKERDYQSKAEARASSQCFKPRTSKNQVMIFMTQEQTTVCDNADQEGKKGEL